MKKGYRERECEIDLTVANSVKLPCRKASTNSFPETTVAQSTQHFDLTMEDEGEPETTDDFDIDECYEFNNPALATGRLWSNKKVSTLSRVWTRKAETKESATGRVWTKKKKPGESIPSDDQGTVDEGAQRARSDVFADFDSTRVADPASTSKRSDRERECHDSEVRPYVGTSVVEVVDSGICSFEVGSCGHGPDPGQFDANDPRGSGFGAAAELPTRQVQEHDGDVRHCVGRQPVLQVGNDGTGARTPGTEQASSDGNDLLQGSVEGQHGRSSGPEEADQEGDQERDATGIGTIHPERGDAVVGTIEARAEDRESGTGGGRANSVHEPQTGAVGSDGAFGTRGKAIQESSADGHQDPDPQRGRGGDVGERQQLVPNQHGGTGRSETPVRTSQEISQVSAASETGATTGSKGSTSEPSFEKPKDSQSLEKERMNRMYRKMFFTVQQPSVEWIDATKVSLPAETDKLNAEKLLELFVFATEVERQEKSGGSKPRKKGCKFGIIEWFCDKESMIGRVCQQLGIDILRIDEQTDAMSDKAMQLCLDFIDNHDRTHIHSAIPCTPWSAIQSLNIHLYGTSFLDRLKKARLISLKQVARTIILLRYNRERQGTSSFEWPFKATGWDKPIVAELLRENSYSTSRVDGCACGVVSKKTGEPMLKPWRIESDCPVLTTNLNKFKCTCTTKHYPCEGSETKGSGFYPETLATTIIKSSYEHHIREFHEQVLATELITDQEFKESLIAVATQEETKAFLELDKTAQQRLLNAARKVHVNTGHKPVEELARLLRKQNAPLASRAAMSRVQCSSCKENSRPEPSPVVNIPQEGTPFKSLSMDIKEAVDGDLRHKFLVIVDNASRFARTVKLHTIPKSQHKNNTTDEIISAFETGWEELFGPPAELVHDPEGAFVSAEMIEKFSQKGILLRPTAGEAHWQNGLCERCIQTVFTTAARIKSELRIPLTRAVSLATNAHNHVSTVHGFTPAQWALGRAPSWQQAMHDESDDIVNIARDGHEAFAQRMLEQISARKIWQEEELKKKIQRAERAKHRRDKVFIPGELVFAWRLGNSKTAGTKKEGLHKGAWYGPCHVLGTESKIENGQVFPGRIVWITIGDRLWRCAPQQLRRASEREHSEAILQQKKPWTFENITKTLVLGNYRDCTAEGEPDHLDPIREEIEDDMPDDPEPNPVPAQTKRNFQEGGSSGSGAQESKVRKRLCQKTPPNQVSFALAVQLAEECATYTQTPLLQDKDMPAKICEVEFPFLENDRAIRKYLKNPEAFVVTSLKKKRVEIKERNLDAADRALIQQAKGKEIREFIREHVVARLREGEIVPKEQIMRMRWVLTWKVSDGEKCGKARLVVLGFEDPYLGSEDTSSPTLNKRSKQMLLQVCVQNGWHLLKGDVTAAFLQGKAAAQAKYALAPPELAEAMGLPKGERVIRLLKSVYGLTTAPLEWFRKVDEVLRALGAEQCVTDPCVWRVVREGRLIGLIGAHVDDFLICGNDSTAWKQFIEVLQASFRWTPWEEQKFKQCGVMVRQNPDGSITQDQVEYLATLSEIEIAKDRHTALNSPVTESERTQLRALLGGLQWLVTQTRVDGMIDVNLLQSCVTTATVETLHSANKVLRKLRQGPANLFTRKIPDHQAIHVVAWSDASWANRRDGKSTGGYLIGLCGQEVLDGKRGHVTVVSWGTNKLKRVAKSSMSSELQALAITEDELHLCRLAWAEFNGKSINLNQIDETVKTVPGSVIIDAKSIYDALTSQNQPLQLAEKRTALELLAYLHNTAANGTETRWVHGGANLADGLTKLGVHPMLREFLETSTWSLVYDPAQQAGKKRQAQGLDKLQNDQDVNDAFVDLAWTKLKEQWPEYCVESDDDEH